MPLNFFSFEPWTIPKVLLNLEDLTKSENLKILLKSVLASYFVIQQNKITFPLDLMLFKFVNLYMI